MRALRATTATILVGLALALPATARADGGAYITFSKTHYLPGEQAEGEGYVYVPAKHQDDLQKGPFYGYLVNAGPGNTDLRIGTVTFEQRRKTDYELHLPFTVPDVAGDYYTVRICNDPCTVAGFQEPLTGTISIVQTEREGTLLTDNEKLHYRNYALARKVRKDERTITELQAELVGSTEATTPLAQASPPPPAPARTVVVHDDRPLVDAWALLGLGGAFLVALACVGVAIAFSRSSRRDEALPVK